MFDSSLPLNSILPAGSVGASTNLDQAAASPLENWFDATAMQVDPTGVDSVSLGSFNTVSDIATQILAQIAELPNQL